MNRCPRGHSYSSPMKIFTVNSASRKKENLYRIQMINLNILFSFEINIKTTCIRK